MSALSRSSTDWRAVAALFAAGLLAAAQFGKVSLALPHFAEAYDRAPSGIAVVVSMVALTGLVFGTVAGSVVARIGPRRMLLAALTLGGALSLAQALLPPFPLLLALRGVEGACHLVIVVAGPTAMAMLSAPKDRPVVMGLWGMFFGVSFAASAVLFPPLLAAGGLPLLLSTHGLAMLALALVMARLLETDPPRRSLKGLGFLQAHRRAYGSPRLLAPALGFVWHTLMFIALLTFLPPTLGPASAAILPLISLASTFAAGWLARRHPPQHIAIAGFAMTAILAVILGLVPPALQFAISCLLFAVIGLVPGASFASVPHLNHDPRDQARANGAIAQLGNLGTASGTPLYAIALSHGMAGMAGLTVALSLTGLAALLLIHGKIVAGP